MYTSGFSIKGNILPNLEKLILDLSERFREFIRFSFLYT